jgi:hypothetical protein
VLRQRQCERGHHVAVALCLGEAADGQPREPVFQAERRAGLRAELVIAGVWRGAQAVGHEEDRARRRGSAPGRLLLGDPAHRGRDVGEPIGQPIGDVAPLPALVLVVDRRDQDRHGRQEPREPRQQVRVDHVGMHDIGAQAAEQRRQPDQAARIWHAEGHAERKRPDTEAGEVRDGRRQREHGDRRDGPTTAMELLGQVTYLALGATHPAVRDDERHAWSCGLGRRTRCHGRESLAHTAFPDGSLPTLCECIFR